MDNSERIILVTGATGRQGGAVLKHLLKNKRRVRALSRTPGSIAAQRLIAEGIELVQGDMSDPSSLTDAMKGCYGVFSIQNYFEYGGEKEVRFGKNMVDAAKQSGISHFIYGSVSGADSNSGVPHFETKNLIEHYVRSSGLAATIVRPVKFMENYYIPQVFKGVLDGKLFDAIKPGKKHQMIALDDVGNYVAECFANSENYLNKTIEIAGEELTNEEVASAMSLVLGRPVKFKRLPLFIVKLAMDKELFRMFRWFNEVGFSVNINETKKLFPSIKVTTLKHFLINENWQRWNKKGSI